jgi:heptosyltransferase II
MAGAAPLFMASSDSVSSSTPSARPASWVDRLSYAVFLLLEVVFSCLPISWIWYAGRAAGWLGHLLAGKYRRLAQRNLRIAFGREKDEAWIRRTAREHFMSLIANVFCGLKLGTMSQEQIRRHVRLEGLEHMQNALKGGQPILGVVAHLSCWELLAKVPEFFAFGRRPASMYQPLSNPLLDRYILNKREKLGYAIFSRRDGFNGPMKHLREHGILGVMVDQHSGDQGLWCPFFDRLASTTPVAAMMAMRTKAMIVSVSIYHEGVARWRVVYAPSTKMMQAQTVEAMTAAMNLETEAIVRERPDQWFWLHNRWKTPKPKFLLDRYRRGIQLPEGYSVEQLQPFHVLVRSPNWLGDACMALPAVRALKKGRPDLQITVLGPEKLRDLWEAQPEVSRFIGKDSSEKPWTVARRLRQSGIAFEVGLLFTHSTRSTLEFWLAGVPRLVGFAGSFRSKLLHHVIAEHKDKATRHHARRYLQMVQVVGSAAGDEALECPIQVGAERRIGICAGAEYGPAKRWPLERYAQVIRQLHPALPDYEWVFFGAPNEAEMGEELSRQVGADIPHTNRVGKTRLAELIQELRRCRLLLTNDTGTMHLAAALGVPTVSLFGSTEPILTGPLGAQHTVLREKVPCSPCFERSCPLEHFDCMMKITPERVCQAVLQQLSAHDDSGAGAGQAGEA